MKELGQFFESLKPLQQLLVSVWAWCIVNLNIGWASTAIGILVMLFHLKVIYYSGKLKKIEYDKACQGRKSLK